jgi:hypothetical protein
VPTSDWYHVQDGKITSVRAYFDTRALSAGRDTHDQQSSAQSGAPAGGRILPSILPALVSAEMELAESTT